MRVKVWCCWATCSRQFLQRKYCDYFIKRHNGKSYQGRSSPWVRAFSYILQIDTCCDTHTIMRHAPVGFKQTVSLWNRWVIPTCISPLKWMVWDFCSQTCMPSAEWATKAANLTTEKNSISISTKHLQLSGITKATPFFCTVAFSCFVNSNDINR